MSNALDLIERNLATEHIVLVLENNSTANEQALQVVHHLLQGLPCLRDALSASDPSPWRERFALRTLTEIHRHLNWDSAVNFLLTTPPELLERRLFVSRYLANLDDVAGGLPLVTRDKLARQINHFQCYLIREKTHLIKTGFPGCCFEGLPWLAERLGRLYPVGRTSSLYPRQTDATTDSDKSPYEWIRIGRNGTVRRGKDPPFTHREASLIEGLDEEKSQRLVALREDVFNAKLRVLRACEKCVTNADTNGFWDQSMETLRELFTAEQAEFLLDADALYGTQQQEATTFSRSLASAIGDLRPFHPGGLNDIIELIGHVQKELTIGTMHNACNLFSALLVSIFHELACRSITKVVIASSTCPLVATYALPYQYA